MNYSKIYNNLVYQDKLKNRKKDNGEYFEEHHINPKCLGGGDDGDNLVLLTTREHYIAHKLLTKIYPDNRKILMAFHFMVHGQQGQSMNLSSRVYEEARELFIKAQSGRCLSDETKKKMSESHKGKKLSEKTKEKIRNKAIGRKVTKETIKILSESHKGISPSNKGKKTGPRSEEVKRQISEKMKGMKRPPRSKEHTQKIIESRRLNKLNNQ